VVLLDARGWVLLQERDEHAPVDPDQWSLVGGGVEDGESDRHAALRALADQAGVTGVELTQVDTFACFCDDWDDCDDSHDSHDVALFLALTDLSDDDVACHVGRQIAFVDPRSIDRLRWGRTIVHGLPRAFTHPAYVERFGRPAPRAFGCVLIVDAEGRLLLQERDEHAPIDPDRWGLPGGHLEPGEEPESGAYRELEEETGVRLPPGTLEHFGTFPVFHPAYGSVDRVDLFVARVDLTDDEIDCREGRRIVFVEPDRARHLELTMTGVLAVPALLGSDAYRRMSR
jgi:8-oxo-dGTP pyrophosphatase MutT (NUDIX family)